MQDRLQHQQGPNMGGAARDGFSQDEQELIRAELDQILGSAAFGASKRCHHFLEFVVTCAMEGRAEDLKERSIGVAVFDKRPDYDTGEDATVRVAANEVRKRLAQYRLEVPKPRVVIDLPLGTYQPAFSFPVHPQVEAEVELAAEQGLSGRRRGWRWTPALAAAALVALAAVVVVQSRRQPEDAFTRFWAPFFVKSKTTLICLDNPPVFVLSDRARRERMSKRGVDPLAGPHVVDIEAGKIESGDLVSSPDLFVGAGDAYAASRFLTMFALNGSPAVLKIGKDINFPDLKTSPSILIGAYSNRWTMKANSTYRFGFDHFSVVDRESPVRAWRLTKVSPDYKSAEDYAIVSRILESYSGEVVVGAAGITNLGTHAASEFLTNPVHLNALLRSAPQGWERMSFQAVLHCEGIGDTPGPPKVVAVHYW